MKGEVKPGSIRTEESFKKDGIIFMGESTVTGINYNEKKV